MGLEVECLQYLEYLRLQLLREGPFFVEERKGYRDFVKRSYELHPPVLCGELINVRCQWKGAAGLPTLRAVNRPSDQWMVKMI
jgi:hypothetical protein